MREEKADESTYRFGYQGQFAEKDDETGWSHFELREYDPVIGRWLVPDPYKEYWSPYIGMGNNPVNFNDPTGGMTDPKDGELNEAGTHQWGYNGITGEMGWSEIMQEVTLTQQHNPTSESVNFFPHGDDNFNGVAYSGIYEKEGDGNFTVFGHGGPL